jgi:hypothetical protein
MNSPLSGEEFIDPIITLDDCLKDEDEAGSRLVFHQVLLFSCTTIPTKPVIKAVLQRIHLWLVPNVMGKSA